MPNRKEFNILEVHAPSDLAARCDRDGYILFRDAALSFQDFIDLSGLVTTSFRNDPSAYGNRILSSPAESVHQAVQGSGAVVLHGELTSLPNSPDHIWFYCEKASSSGGSTILCSGVSLAAELPQDVRSTLKSKSLVYHHRWGPENWRHALGVESVDEAMERMLAMDGIAEVRATPAGSGDVIEFEYSTGAFPRRDAAGNDVFMNGFMNIMSRKNQGMCTVSFDRGEEIPDALVSAVQRATESTQFLIDLRPGEALLVDNLKVLHGRAAFTGERIVHARFGRSRFLD